jgi:twitching motility two-component system response regulator PilH
MRSEKILFCDGSITEPDYLKNILEDANCVLIITQSGSETIDKAKSEKPDFIYIDISSLGAESYSVMLSLRNDPDTKSIPIIFYSSQYQTADSIWFKIQSEKNSVSKSYSKGAAYEFMAPENHTIH